MDRIYELVELPGVVFIELDGRLEVQMEDVVPAHGVDLVWQDTGYTGAGVTMAIIDTGIDGNHSGLDDLDDDNSTNDPKVIAFFDAVNNPGATNGTEIYPYDDNGHGTHCAGITAGTGAPTFQHVGVAPHANRWSESSEWKRKWKLCSGYGWNGWTVENGTSSIFEQLV